MCFLIESASSRVGTPWVEADERLYTDRTKAPVFSSIISIFILAVFIAFDPAWRFFSIKTTLCFIVGRFWSLSLISPYWLIISVSGANISRVSSNDSRNSATVPRHDFPSISYTLIKMLWMNSSLAAEHLLYVLKMALTSSIAVERDMVWQPHSRRENSIGNIKAIKLLFTIAWVL